MGQAVSPVRLREMCRDASRHGSLKAAPHVSGVPPHSETCDPLLRGMRRDYFPVDRDSRPPEHTILVHTGDMRSANKTVRRSVSLPSNVAAQVRSMARRRRLSANRMLVELLENGIEAEKRKQQEFFDLAERFRRATDREEVKRLGDQLGRMVFGN